MTYETDKIDRLRVEVRNSQWPEEKKRAFLDYQDYLVAASLSNNTQKLYSLHIHRLGDFLPKKLFKDYTEQDMMAYKNMLARKYSPYNVHNQILDVMTFLKRHLKLEKKPDCLKWYDTNKHRKKVVKKLNPKEVLQSEEIKALITAAGSRRNKAIIFCLWESGCRIEEFLNVRVGDIEIDGSVISMWINKGKTREAERQIFLIQSAPTLMDWMQDHEYKNDKNTLLFYSIRKGHHGGRLWGTNINSILKRAAKKADIEKKVHPHALRKARATFIAKKGYGDQMMRKMFGWSDNSPMPSHYSSLDADSVKEALMKDAGLVNKEDSRKELTAQKCPFCGTTNSADATICKNSVCLRPITLEGIKEQMDKRDNALKEVIRQELSQATETYLDKQMSEEMKKINPSESKN